MQETCNSIADTLELRLSCTNPLLYMVSQGQIKSQYMTLFITNVIHVTKRLYTCIAQIPPLSFQGSHRTQTQTSEVRWLHASVVTEWSPACLHKQFPGDLHRGNSRNPQMEDVHNLINIGPTNPIQILNQHEISEHFVCVIQMILLTKIKNIEVGTGAQQQRQEVYWG